jgi:cytochrome c oxidase subunit IV
LRGTWDDEPVHKPWIRWTVIVVVVLVAASLVISVVPR